MHHSRLSKALLLTAGLGLALAGGACNRSANRADEATPGAAGTSGVSSTITLSGCLQKGSGMNNFILTQAMKPEAVGTGGSTPDSGAVAREQRRAAAKSYRLRGGDNDQLNDLLGKQVTVSGTITDRGDIATDRNERRTAGSAQTTTTDIDSGDIPKLEVQSIVRVSDACGSESPSRP